MRELAVAEVGLDTEERVFVPPIEGDFENVHRAGMEVYWDRQSRRLFHPKLPRDWTPVRWLQQIIAAVADECDVALKLNAQDHVVRCACRPTIRDGEHDLLTSDIHPFAALQTGLSHYSAYPA